MLQAFLINNKRSSPKSVKPKTSEFEASIERLKQAEQNFNYSYGEYVDVATIEYTAALMTTSIMFKEIKNNRTEPYD